MKSQYEPDVNTQYDPYMLKDMWKADIQRLLGVYIRRWASKIPLWVYLAFTVAVCILYFTVDYFS